jgi:enamine deaminase RidA (YjgF/YER057c/UK114 family)
MTRKLVSSGSPYEPMVGNSRAVRVGTIVTVAGAAPLGPDGHTVGKGNAAAQARRCFEIIAGALEKTGASLQDVVRTRILLTRIDDWQSVAGVHGEFFRDIRPVNTIMQVSRFIDPDWLIEIEAAAVIDDEGDAAQQLGPPVATRLSRGFQWGEPPGKPRAIRPGSWTVPLSRIDIWVVDRLLTITTKVQIL